MLQVETNSTDFKRIKTVTECNREEVDTSIILLAYLETNGVAVVSKDTDVFILLVRKYAYHNIKRNWFFKQDAEKYDNLRKICDCLGKNVRGSILAIWNNRFILLSCMQSVDI